MIVRNFEVDIKVWKLLPVIFEFIIVFFIFYIFTIWGAMFIVAFLIIYGFLGFILISIGEALGGNSDQIIGASLATLIILILYLPTFIAIICITLSFVVDFIVISYKIYTDSCNGRDSICPYHL